MPWNARPKLDAAIKAAKKLKGPIVVAKLDPPGGGGSAGRSGEGWIRPKHLRSNAVRRSTFQDAEANNRDCERIICLVAALAFAF